jgi:pimeloyl-ACP methyl ester carboxylesterase
MHFVLKVYYINLIQNPTIMKILLLILSLSLMLISCNNKEKKSEILIDGSSGDAEVNGTKLYYETYETEGSGDAIVLVHGNEGDRRHWDFQIGPLAMNYKVIRYDVRGYGKSALPNPEEAYSDYEDLKALLEYLNINEAHICGLSMGSGIAVSFAIAYPENCKSLISVGPWASGYGSGDFKSPAADSLFKAMGITASIARDKGSKEATDYFLTGNEVFKNTLRSPKTIDHLRMIGYDYSFWGFINESKRLPLQPPAISQLDKIKIPTLIVTAEYDLEACKEIAEIMKREIEGSKLVSIVDAGHCMNIDKPEEFNEQVTSFIKDLKN